MILYESRYVCMVQSQRDLNEAFGPNKFKVVLEETNERQRFFLEALYNASVADIETAKQIMNAEVDRALEKIRERAPIKLQQLIDENNDNTVKVYTADDYIEARTWLEDVSQQCPGCVLFVAALKKITNEAAASLILNEQLSTEQKNKELRNIMFTCLAFVVSSDDVQDIRNAISEAADTIKNY